MARNDDLPDNKQSAKVPNNHPGRMTRQQIRDAWRADQNKDDYTELPLIQVQQFLADTHAPGGYFYSTTIIPHPSIAGLVAAPMRHWPQSAEEAGYWIDLFMDHGFSVVMLPHSDDMATLHGPEGKAAMEAMIKALRVDMSRVASIHGEAVQREGGKVVGRKEIDVGEIQSKLDKPKAP